MHYNVYTMHKERDDNMTKKKEEVARLAEQFMSIKSEEGKAMAILGDRWGPWDVGVILRLFVPGRPMLDRPDNGKGKGIGGSRGKGNGYYSNICLCRGEGGREERESAGTDGQGGYIGLEGGGEQDGLSK